MARKMIRVMSAADYSYVTRGGAITYPVPFAITLGVTNGVKELEIFNAPLVNRNDTSIGEVTSVSRVLEGTFAKYRHPGTNVTSMCEVIAITARKVTIRPLEPQPHDQLNADGMLVEDMEEFCIANSL